MPKAQVPEGEVGTGEVAELLATAVEKAREYLAVRRDVRNLMREVENLVRAKTFTRGVKVDGALTNDLRFAYDDEGSWLEVRNLDLIATDPTRVEEIRRAVRSFDEHIQYYSAIREKLKALREAFAREAQ